MPRGIGQMLRTKQLSIVAALLSLLTLPIKGDANEVCSAPLCCGGLSLAIRGGGGPAIFTHRGENDLTATGDIAPVVTQGDLPEFFRQFRAPWTVGAELAWNISQRVQLFLEYSYTQAAGKPHTLFIVDASFFEYLSDLKMNAGYLGARYYFDGLPCCFGAGPITPYVGFKVGVAWQQQMRTDYFFLDIPIATNVLYYLSQTCISTGLQIGAEWWFCSCWSLVLQSELIITQGVAGNGNIPLADIGIGLTNLFIGQTGWLVTFPVTLGLRWTF
jgi:hypothetical protein